MDRLRILLASHDSFLSLGLSVMIQQLGHQVVGSAHNWIEMHDKARLCMPNMMLISTKINGMDGLEALKKIMTIHPLPAIVITESSKTELIEKATAAGAAGCLIKPVSQYTLEPALAFAHSLFKQVQLMKKEINDLEEALKTRKLVEQAKGLLMKRHCLSEAEAFRTIQTMSRNQNIAMGRIAEAIILTDKLDFKQLQIDPKKMLDVTKDCSIDSIS